ncbi:acyltransferase family protein [Methylopila turkensis]|uniref:Acyltransferase n=1 Tax=Methylopila turkensis TaxID=1437816 RepID=A0A9W6JJT6_9HYPH|nr:acyltransferase [Methylopila turkensis]GLK78337.1 acyltransferase [Methylopila turkensis]
MTPTLADCLDRRSNDLAAVRIIAAAAVLWAHAWVVTTPGLKTADFMHVFGFSLDFHGVHAFFILSGMLLARSYMTRPDALRFVVARLMRYLPGIFVSTAIAALVIGPLVTRLPLEAYFADGAPFRFIAAVTSLVDINATLPATLDRGAEPNTLYIPLWTVRYELVFAICLAVAGALGLIGRRMLTLAALVATLAVNVVWFWNGEAAHLDLGTPHHLVRFASAFGIGIALATFADRIPVSKRLFALVAAVAAPLAFTQLAALAGMALIAYAIVVIGFARPPLAGALARLGTWSYGFYVSGFLIEQCLVHAAPSLSAVGVFLLAFPLALVAGWLSWRYVEAPSIGLVNPITGAIARRLPWRDGAADPLPARSSDR